MHPIIRALARHKLPAMIIVVEVAMACAVVSNTLYLLSTFASRVNLSTGMDGDDVLWLRSSGLPTTGTPTSSDEADAVAVRGAAHVRHVARVSALPLTNTASYRFKVGVDGDDVDIAGTAAGMYLWGKGAVQALGVRLMSGRDFLPEEYVEFSPFSDGPAPASVLITRALAVRLFGSVDAVGRRLRLQLNGQPSATVVGVIDDLLSPSLRHGGDDANQVILPVLRVPGGLLVVRAERSHASQALDAAKRALFGVSHARILTKAELFSQTEHEYFRGDRSMIWTLAMISAFLTLLTAISIVSISNYWLIQRRRSIGIRRALGARRSQIIAHFLAENLVVVASGAALGLAGAVVLNTAMMRWFEVGRMPASWLIWIVLLLLGLGQAAVIMPAWRASRIHPGAIAAGG
ncbi:putative ABC transport system permease protein [Luteibacter sp. Sphag1AF]|uniref:ABC transporter permease n=1 Tax=Luteibacter sp. Sphag1AF TaxID=2587031 RepID=UPI001612D7F0|nr:FtsX-like permease family protein [Luteibacter sp. Sphag1AF]MBB3226071.1 putative ABC transport system permease protein [Luteibacter sp. Sphag1AF]